MTTYADRFVYPLLNHGPVNPCWCAWCGNEWSKTMVELGTDPWNIPNRFMITCPQCGNKRCPHASYHGHDCTRSNEPNQAGSTYGDFHLNTSWNGLGDFMDGIVEKLRQRGVTAP